MTINKSECVCPNCGSTEVELIKQKLVCAVCHIIIETCCEGERG